MQHFPFNNPDLGRQHEELVIEEQRLRLEELRAELAGKGIALPAQGEVQMAEGRALPTLDDAARRVLDKHQSKAAEKDNRAVQQFYNQVVDAAGMAETNGQHAPWLLRALVDEFDKMAGLD